MIKKTLFLLLFSSFSIAYSGIEFADETATIRVKNGSTLNIGSGGQSVAGTVKHDTGGTVTGTVLTFSNGVINRDGATALLTGTYDGDADPGPAFALTGDGLLDAGAGFSVPVLSISGDNNTLAGQPVLSSALTLGTNVDLNCQLSIPLNKSITLDGGTVTLKSDLTCANDVLLKGSGTVALGGYNYVLASYYSSALTGTLAFANAQNIELQGRTPFNADWTFSGTSVIYGKGQTLDLTSGGTITIAAGATLVVRDMLLYGVTDSNIIFGDADSTLEVDQSSVHLTESVSTTSGKVKVSGDSTFVLSENDWTFDSDGELTIDGAILSLNVANNTGASANGTVKAPLAVYDEGTRQSSDLTTNLAGDNMAMVNGAVITEGSGSGGGGIIGGSSAVSFDKSTLMSPGDVVTITSDTTLDGQGSRILFSRSSSAQLVINENVTYTIKNVEFSGITNTTFQFKKGAKLKVDTGVIFTLADDVVWSAGQIELTGTSNVFEVRGMGGVQQFELSSGNTGGDKPHEEIYTKHLALGTHSMSLHNIIFKGLRHVSSSSTTSNGVTTTGSIVLAGDATVDVDVETVDETFIVRGLENRIRFRLNDTFLTGGIRYDGSATSLLRAEFMLPATFHGVPELNIGTQGMQLSSSFGHAYFISEAPEITIVNHKADSFTLGENGFLGGKKINVTLNPIAQTSSRVTLSPGLQLASTLSSGALVPSTTLLDAMKTLPFYSQLQYRSLTAFELREWARIGLLEHTRAIQLPNEDKTTVLHYQSGLALPELAGNIRIYAENTTRYSNFGIDDVRDANITLQDGVYVVQSASATTLKSSDTLNIIGGTMQTPNTLEIGENITFNGDVLLDDDAVLQIDCVSSDTNPVVTFGSAGTLEFGARSSLVITGKGTVVLPDGFIVNLQTNSNLILAGGVQLVLQNGEEVTAKGNGSITVERGGNIVIENGSSLTCGNAFDDNLKIQVRTGASIQVGDAFTSEAGSSYFSFRKATSELDCSQGGTLTIANNGICEINAKQGVSDPGNVQRIDFGGSGLLYIAKGGSLQIADNLPSNAGITLSLHGSQINGSGIIGILNDTLQGQVQNNIDSLSNATAKDIVRTLAQTVSSLTHTTVFLDVNNNRQALTKNNALVALDTNQVVLSEDADGAFTGYHALTGRRFTYTADGVAS